MIEVILELWVKGSWVERDRRTLTESLYRIGRAADCEIRVDYAGAYIGRYQCTLTRYDTSSWKKAIGYKIRDGVPDQPSRNGTWLNGKRIEGKIELNDEDVITLVSGHLRMIYREERASRISDRLEDLTLTSENATES